MGNVGVAGGWNRLGAAADEAARLVGNLILAVLLAGFYNAISNRRRRRAVAVPDARRPPAAAPHRDDGAVVAHPRAAAAPGPERGAEPAPSREDLDKLQSSADTAATHVGNLYLTFLLFGVYFAIIIGSTTHEQLLRENPVTLPLLNVGVPLFAFYWITPALFVLFHFNLLIQFHLLAGKLHRLRLAVDRSIEDEGARATRFSLLYPLPFSHMLIGRHHGLLPRLLFRLMVWISVIVLPVLVLFAAQVRFLAYHDGATTTAHRIILLVDLLLLCLLWPGIAHPSSGRLGFPRNWLMRSRRAHRTVRHGPGWRDRLRGALTVHTVNEAAQGLVRRLLWSARKLFLVFAVSVAAAGASFLVFTFPGDPMERALLREDGWLAALYPASWRVERDGLTIFWPTDALFGSWDALSRNLVVREANLVAARPTAAQIEELGEEDAWRIYGDTLSLRGRDLRYADFFDSIMTHADMRHVDLQGARLNGADLQGARLDGAKLQGAVLAEADLQGAHLDGADLQGAVLAEADLQGAHLDGADLQGAVLAEADLQGADLSLADLPGTRLDGANLRGAHLYRGDLPGAVLSHADLQGADLSLADLQGASLIGAGLQGASLIGAGLQGAVLSHADLQGASLRSAGLQGASLADADLRGADLQRAELWRAVFVIEDVAGLAAETGRPEKLIRDNFGEGPFAAQLELADLRGARIGPMSEEEVAALIARIEKDVGDEEVRERVADRLRELLGDPDQPPFGPVLPEELMNTDLAPVRIDERLESPGAYATVADLLPRGGMEPEAYEQALGEHLAGLACGEGSNRHVALGVAQRRLNDAGETVARVLATALLDEGCGGMVAYLGTLSEEERGEVRRRLERFAAAGGEGR